LNPICHLLALLGGATIVVVSRIALELCLKECWWLVTLMTLLSVSNWAVRLKTYKYSCNDACRKAGLSPLRNVFTRSWRRLNKRVPFHCHVLKKIYFQKHSAISVTFRTHEFRAVGYQVIVAEKNRTVQLLFILVWFLGCETTLLLLWMLFSAEWCRYELLACYS
jgi:hypothetical protein